MASYATHLSLALASAGAEVRVLSFGTIPEALVSVSNVEVISLARSDPTWLSFLGGPSVEYAVIRSLLKRVVEASGGASAEDVIHFTAPPSVVSPHRGLVVATAWNDLNLDDALRRNLTGFHFPFSVISVPATIQYHLQDRRGYSRADVVLCGTRHLTSKLDSGGRRRVRRVFHPIRLPPAGELANISNSKPEILFMSRDLGLPRKNLSLLLRAASKLVGAGNLEFSLKLVGSRDKRIAKEVSRLAFDGGLRVRTPGFLTGASRSKAFSEASIFVIPSIVEDYSYALLEAMSHGLAVVASDIPSFRDITEDGSNGALVEPTQVDSLTSALEWLIRDVGERVRAGAKSRELIAERHAYSQAGKALVELYSEARQTPLEPKRVAR